MQSQSTTAGAYEGNTLLAAIRAKNQRGPQLWLRIMAVAAAYFIMGRLGLLLSLDNGYSTLIWPPSGVALIALFFYGLKVWPGLVLGAFLVNTPFGGNLEVFLSNAASMHHNYLIALGNSTQAVIAYLILRRVLADLKTITRPADIVLFFLIAGPVCSLFASTVGASSLYVYGIIEAKEYATVWLTWWLGDTNGALIAAPVILVAAMPSHKGAGARRIVGSFSLLLVLMLLALVVYLLQQWTDDGIRQRLNNSRALIALNMDMGLAELTHDLRLLGSVIELEPGLSREAYEGVASTALKVQPRLMSVSWNRRIKGAERGIAEQAIKEAYGINRGLTWRTPRGALEPAPAQDRYTYVHFIVPFAGNRAAVGYAVSTNPSRLATLRQTQNSGRAAVTPRLQLVQDDSTGASAPSYGVLMFVPVSVGGEIIGYSTGVVRINPLIDAALAAAGVDNIQYRLLDTSAPEGEQLLASNIPGDGSIPPLLDNFTTRQTIQVLDHTWTLFVSPSEAFLKAFEDVLVLQLVFVLAVITTAVLSVFVLVMMGGQIETQRLVQARTAELEQANKVKSRFLNNMSHEIRTPMNGVVGMLRLLAETPLNKEQQQMVRLSRGSANTLLTVINDVLDISMMERGEFSITNAPTDVGEAVRECVMLLDGIAQDKKLILSCEINDVLQKLVETDGARLKQVLYNLIGNAIKFTPEGGHVWVETSITQSDEGWAHVDITVRDSGIGISDEDQRRVIKRFAQVDGSITRGQQGAGLGLSISASILELMGGGLALKSTLGEGTTVFVTLDGLRMLNKPASGAEGAGRSLEAGVLSGHDAEARNDTGELACASKDASQSGGNNTAEKALASAGKPCFVFVFEDNIVNKLLLQKVFAPRMETVEVASDGQSGLDMLAARIGAGERLPDVILMDIQMPVMNGFDATKKLLAVGSPFAHIPILALTADALPEQRKAFLAAGMVDVINKPFDFDEMFEKIGRYATVRTSEKAD